MKGGKKDKERKEAERKEGGEKEAGSKIVDGRLHTKLAPSQILSGREPVRLFSSSYTNLDGRITSHWPCLIGIRLRKLR